MSCLVSVLKSGPLCVPVCSFILTMVSITMIRTHFLGLGDGCGDSKRISGCHAAATARGRYPRQRRWRRGARHRCGGAAIVAGTLALLWIGEGSHSGGQTRLVLGLPGSQLFQAGVLLRMHNLGSDSSRRSSSSWWNWRALLLLSIGRSTWWCTGCATSMIGGGRSTYGCITLVKSKRN